MNITVFNREFLFKVCLLRFNAGIHLGNFSDTKKSLILPKPTYKKIIISFPCSGISFSVLEFEKIQIQSEKRYLIAVLSTNKVAEYKRKKGKKNQNVA